MLIAGFLPPVLLLTFGWVDHFFDDAEGVGVPVATEHVEIEQEAESEISPEDLDIPDDHNDPDHHGRYDNYRPVAHRPMRFIIVVTAVVVLLFCSTIVVAFASPCAVVIVLSLLF